MNASNVDQALTSPVALRRNSAGLVPGAVPNVVSAICFLLTSSSVDQLIALDSFFGVELDERPHQHAFLIGAARVDGQRLADLERALALVDVAVQREERLMSLDCFADCRRADRAQRPAPVQESQVGVDCRRLVEACLEGRTVEVED